jgi:hypothetical protein
MREGEGVGNSENDDARGEEQETENGKQRRA